ncbi:MAG: galactose oxidase early set domain-containing protein, partial [Acidimicrobiia bacterium]
VRTEAWYGMARISRDRTYHHSAVLLPDGRVLLGGHAPASSPAGGGDIGGPFPNNDRDPSFEIFTPHYLFRGERPLIRHVQAGIRWDSVFDLETRQALMADSVVLVRLGSPQHIIDSDQRTVRLDFTRHSGRLAVTAPPNGAIAPPGYYYLFLNQATRRGPIPSMARVVKIGLDEDLSEAPQPFPDLGRSSEPVGAAHEDEDSSPTAPVDEQVSELLGVNLAQGPPASAVPAGRGLLVAGDMPRRRALL